MVAYRGWRIFAAEAEEAGEASHLDAKGCIQELELNLDAANAAYNTSACKKGRADVAIDARVRMASDACLHNSLVFVVHAYQKMFKIVCPTFETLKRELNKMTSEMTVYLKTTSLRVRAIDGASTPFIAAFAKESLATVLAYVQRHESSDLPAVNLTPETGTDLINSMKYMMTAAWTLKENMDLILNRAKTSLEMGHEVLPEHVDSTARRSDPAVALKCPSLTVYDARQLMIIADSVDRTYTLGTKVILEFVRIFEERGLSFSSPPVQRLCRHLGTLRRVEHDEKRARDRGRSKIASELAESNLKCLDVIAEIDNLTDWVTVHSEEAMDALNHDATSPMELVQRLLSAIETPLKKADDALRSLDGKCSTENYERLKRSRRFLKRVEEMALDQKRKLRSDHQTVAKHAEKIAQQEAREKELCECITKHAHGASLAWTAYSESDFQPRKLRDEVTQRLGKARLAFTSLDAIECKSDTVLLACEAFVAFRDRVAEWRNEEAIYKKKHKRQSSAA